MGRWLPTYYPGLYRLINNNIIPFSCLLICLLPLTCTSKPQGLKLRSRIKCWPRAHPLRTTDPFRTIAVPECCLQHLHPLPHSTYPTCAHPWDRILPFWNLLDSPLSIDAQRLLVLRLHLLCLPRPRLFLDFPPLQIVGVHPRGIRRGVHKWLNGSGWCYTSNTAIEARRYPLIGCGFRFCRQWRFQGWRVGGKSAMVYCGWMCSECICAVESGTVIPPVMTAVLEVPCSGWLSTWRIELRPLRGGKHRILMNEVDSRYLRGGFRCPNLVRRLDDVIPSKLPSTRTSTTKVSNTTYSLVRTAEGRCRPFG